MNNQEYIIINKKSLQKRIEELEKAQKENPLTAAIWKFAKDELQKVLSQSTPLIPELEKAYDEGVSYLDTTLPIECKQDYISNLKLDI